jgi:hypothetical protein
MKRDNYPNNLVTDYIKFYYIQIILPTPNSHAELGDELPSGRWVVDTG